jgi:3-oxoadipate enol-lactonase
MLLSPAEKQRRRDAFTPPVNTQKLRDDPRSWQEEYGMPSIERDGTKIHYESYGQGAPLVLLHALSLNRYAWTHQAFAFARTNRVIVLDQRGHGLSDKPASGYAITEMTRDLLAVLDHAGVADAVLVGNSAGGMVALQAALDAPERVRALVVVSSATNLAPHVPSQVLEAYTNRFEAAFDFMMDGALSARTKRERPEVAAFLHDAFRVRENFAREVFLSCIRDPGGVFGWNIEDRLTAVQKPALVLAGEEDQSIPMEAVRRLASALPHAQLEVVPDVGHYHALERPDDFNRRLRAFLDVTARGP